MSPLVLIVVAIFSFAVLVLAAVRSYYREIATTRFALEGERSGRRPSTPQIVELYRLSTEERDGGTKVIVCFETAKGNSRFEFAPPYAYVLSNELCRISAQSAPKASHRVEELTDDAPQATNREEN